MSVQQVTYTPHAPHRQKLPDTRYSVTLKRTICNFECYIIVGFFDDKTDATLETAAQPGEVFIKLTKHGTEMSGLADTCAMLLSMALQYGVPWGVLFQKMRGMRFGTDDGEYCSLIDGIANCINEVVDERRRAIDPTDNFVTSNGKADC